MAAEGQEELKVAEKGIGAGVFDGELIEHTEVKGKRRQYWRILWMEWE